MLFGHSDGEGKGDGVGVGRRSFVLSAIIGKGVEVGGDWHYDWCRDCRCTDIKGAKVLILGHVDVRFLDNGNE